MKWKLSWENERGDNGKFMKQNNHIYSQSSVQHSKFPDSLSLFFDLVTFLIVQNRYTQNDQKSAPHNNSNPYFIVFYENILSKSIMS